MFKHYTYNTFFFGNLSFRNLPYIGCQKWFTNFLCCFIKQYKYRLRSVMPFRKNSPRSWRSVRKGIMFSFSAHNLPSSLTTATGESIMPQRQVVHSGMLIHYSDSPCLLGNKPRTVARSVANATIGEIS